MALIADKISFKYPGNPHLILNEVSLSINQGEIVGLIGNSGRGKSTLAKLLAGFEKPLSGTVSLDGSPLAARGLSPVQLIFQHPELAVNPRWQLNKIVNEGYEVDAQTLTQMGIRREWLTRYANELSGGELQRFCIARALHPDLKFLLCDEITTMLDAITQANIWQALVKIARERNLGLLVITHNRSLADRICSRQVELN